MENKQTIDLRQIATFRRQINRVPKDTKGADEIQHLFTTLSDDAIGLLVDFSIATSGLSMDSAKIPLAVGCASIDSARSARAYLGSVIAMQLDMVEMPTPYKKLFLTFLENGNQTTEYSSYVRKLVRYYLRVDKMDPVFYWVNFEYLYELMKRTSEEKEMQIDDLTLGRYFMGLYANAHRTIKALTRTAYALASGARPHNLARQIAKGDRFYKLEEIDQSLEKNKKDTILLKRLSIFFDVAEREESFQEENLSQFDPLTVFDEAIKSLKS